MKPHFTVPARVADHMLPTPDVRATRSRICPASSVVPCGEVSMRAQLEIFIENIAIPAAVLLTVLVIAFWAYLLIQL
jgi:hypothetical protein